jgi:N-acetyl-beta-hexosaminidase
MVSGASAKTKVVRIQVDSDAAPQLKIGVEAIALSLKKMGFTVGEKSSSVKILLQVESAPKAESYEIGSSSSQVVVKGSDATGAMYGAFDVSEQIEAGQFPNVHPVTRSPFLEIRGENIFITTQDITDSASSFWSDEYWQIYLDMLAHDRYNLLDIHGPCDAVSLDFPNAFAYCDTGGFPRDRGRCRAGHKEHGAAKVDHPASI